MKRLFVLAEGPTEEAFVKDVLAPHLADSAATIPIIVASSRATSGHKSRGGGDWTHWKRDLLRLIRGNGAADAAFTTLFDLYGLPRDFPDLKQHSKIMDPVRRADALERVLSETVDDRRFIPYLQVHEFEALVLASLDGLEGYLERDDLKNIPGLRRDIIKAGGPENVNDGEQTAPSKRLEAAIPGYNKIIHGNLAILETVETAGLAALRKQCPRFDAWIERLEQL